MAFITGQVVRDKNFWNRKLELEDIWEAIKNGEHSLLVAPRRVGKTSIMYKILDEPKDNYIALYMDSEEDNFEHQFWARLFNSLKKEEFTNKFKSNITKFKAIIKAIDIKKISLSGIEFKETKAINYKDAFEELMNSLPKEQKVIIMIDEFAQTIENIIKYDSEENALNLLKTHRAIRQANQSNNIVFIYAGSIGLESVVAKLDGMKHINDLKPIKVSPLEIDDAHDFISHLLTHNSIKVDKIQIDYMLDKIEWLIPFYIQLILDEIKKLSRKNPNITNDTVDSAIDNALEHKNYFDNWRSKIKDAFSDEGYLFSKEVLNIISEHKTISKNNIANIADKYGVSDDEKRETLQSLVYDGYINNSNDIKIYRFNSPILRMWWYKYVAN
ncbi:MAG: ATP-binding protein [Helicobacteraceae bacterium]|nr:ATP-binding protein [Helicobacteraceae bacterium]